MSDLYNSYCLSSCSPALIISLTYAVNDITKVAVYDENSKLYCDDQALYSYSLDGTCWSNYGTRDEINNITSGLNTDFYVKVKVNGTVGDAQVCNQSVEYSTALDSGFNFGSTCESNANLYSPYTNMETSMALNQLLVDYVSCIVGIPIYYFKVTPTLTSKDLTFKEYCLLNVSAVKQIKLIVANGEMPSSKPEFSEFGIDFQTDWETYISKSVFATAFGNDALPMEHDFIYIPMMKRMWMVNSAYEEKKDAFMWNATYFTVFLVKYQEKESIDLGNQEEFVNELVTKKYEELFGEDENLGSGEGLTEMPAYIPDNLYFVFDSDAVRKKASKDNIEFKKQDIHQRAVNVADNFYLFTDDQASVVYQHLFCGNEGSCSFLINPTITSNNEYNIINIGGIAINISSSRLYLLNNEDISIQLNNNSLSFVYLRWSLKLNIIELIAAEYTHPNIPLYKLRPFHYYFDIDNAYEKYIGKYDIELTQDSKLEVSISNFNGFITNFKLFEKYIDNTTDLLQLYPTNSYLIINDTARKFVELNGNKV